VAAARVSAATAAGFGAKPSPASAAIVARNWKAINKSTIVGSADVIVVRWHLLLKGCQWHKKGEKEWLGLRAREWSDKDGNRQFADVIGFVNHCTARRFREAALAAIKAAARSDGGAPP
jgi:hypothetical protein